MAFKNLIAFGAGEITPELYERGNLDKFRTGLTRLRNCIVTKMGGLRGRAGTRLLFTPKSGAVAKYLYIQSKNYLLEFTNKNIRVKTGFDPDTYTFVSLADIDLSLYPAGDDISKIHFTHGNKYLFLFADGLETLRIDLDKAFTSPSTSVTQMRDVVAPYDPWTAAATFTYAAGVTPPTGYEIQYFVTFVLEGVETFRSFTSPTLRKPAGLDEHNVITISITKASLAAGTPYPQELRVYQRPVVAGDPGLIAVMQPVETATHITFTVRDYGVAPVFSDVPPKYVSQFESDTKVATGSPGVYVYPPTSKTGLVYQDRLIFSGSTLDNRVFGSRTGTTAMSRDFPLQADSAVSFKIGSDGGLKIQRFFDGRGLLMFTTVGVYETPADLLTPDTAYGVKRGPYVATDKVEPIQLGGFVTIYDKRLKSVIGLTPSGNDQGYAYSEFSIFSAHLIKGRTIVSWALQDAETQVLWIALDDGKVLSFSFQDEQMLRSWAWHDTKDGLVEEVFVMDVEGGNDIVCFAVNRGGTRYVEAMTERDAEFLEYVGTDSSVVFKQSMLNGTMTAAPVVPDTWDGELTLTSSGPIFNGLVAGLGPVGSIFRWFNPVTGSAIDLTVTEYTSATVVKVIPDLEFPSEYASINNLWVTYNTLTGLSHLNGKKVSVRVDGFTHASPLNTEKTLETYTVSSGSITLAGGTRGAFVSVGLPIVQDIQTLEVDTVEQSPTKLEGQIVNNLYLSYFESLFLYAGSTLPTDDTVTGMDNQEYQVEPDEGIDPTIPPQPITERLEMQIQGDWKVRGSVALRNVDPQPIGLRAIIPDTEVIRN